MGVNIKERTRQRQRALMKNHCVISHGSYEVEKLTVPDSGFCVKKMKEKSVTFFLQLKAKKKSKFL